MTWINWGSTLDDLEYERTYFLWVRLFGRDIVFEVRIS